MPNSLPSDANQPKIDPQVIDRRRVLAFVFGLAMAVRFLNLLLLSQQPFFDYKIGDAARYDQWAHEIAEGDWLGDQVFYQAPLYPYFLAVIYATVGDHVFLLKLVQALIAALSCSVLAAAAWNFFDRRAGIAAGIVLACYIPSVFLETLIQKSILDLLFICLIIWLTSCILKKSLLRHWLTLGACIGGLCLTRENAVALIPLFGLWCLAFRFVLPGLDCQVQDRLSKEKSNSIFSTMARNAVFGAGLAMILLPVAFRNYWVGGEFHLTTSQLGPNFYIGNNPNADGYYRPLSFGRGNAKYEQADAVAIAEDAKGQSLTPGEVSGFYLEQSGHYISEQPWHWLQLLGKKTLLSVNSVEIIDTEDQYAYEKYSPLMYVLSKVFHFGALLPLAILGLWRTRQKWRELLVLYGMLALFQATLVAFFVFGRYRFPVVPLMIVFAAPVLADACLFVKRQLGAQSVGPQGERYPRWLVVSAIVAFLVSSIPMISKPAQLSTTFNNFAVQSLIRGDWKCAESYLEESLEAQPDYALAHNSKGVLHRECGEVELAKYHFQRAFELEPKYTTAKVNYDRLVNKQKTKKSRNECCGLDSETSERSEAQSTSGAE